MFFFNPIFTPLNPKLLPIGLCVPCMAAGNRPFKDLEFFNYFVAELRYPPYVFLETDEYVRIVGEELKIRCSTHNPNFNYNVTWKYTTKSVCVKCCGNSSRLMTLMISSDSFTYSSEGNSRGEGSLPGREWAGHTEHSDHLRRGPHRHREHHLHWHQRGWREQHNDLPAGCR